MVLRVSSVREGVADEVERNGDKAQDDGGVEQLVPQARLHHHLAAVVDQVAQRGRFHRKAQADIGDEHLAADGGGDGQGHAQHDDRYQIGQQVAQHDAADGGADAAGSHVVITVADDQDLVADKARHGDPARDGHAQDQGLDAGRRDIGDQDQDDGGRDVITDVVQLGEEEIELADIAPEHAHRDAHHGLDEGHEEGDGQTGACTGPDAGPQVLADGIGTPDKALFPGGDIAELDTGGRVYLAEIGICLTGQIRLQKGKAHHEHQCNEQGHGDLILEESTEGAAPIAVIGVGGGLGTLLAEPGGGEQLVLGQVGPSGGAVLLQLVQVVFQNSCLVIFHVEQHYRPPSFLPKLMRGSMSTMSRSPRIRPMMPTQAYSSTMPCTMVLSWRWTQVTSRPPMPGMEYRLSM